MHMAQQYSSSDSPTGVLQRNKLKLVLIAGDTLALAIGYSLVLFAGPYARTHGFVAASLFLVISVFGGLWSAQAQGLFLGRVSSVRVIEMTRLARAMSVLAATMVLVDRVTKLGLRIREAVGGALLAFVFLMISRSVFRAWVAHKRSGGLYTRRVLVVGCDEEAVRISELFSTHSELGMAVVGIVGDREESLRHGLGALWMGKTEDAERLALTHGVTGVIVSAMSLSPARLNTLIRNLQAIDIHVHLATGIAGIDSRRLRSQPLSHEPLFYVEATSLSFLQLSVKRVFDTVAAGVGLVLISPLMLAVAIAIKINDRGPVFFRQIRVGRDGAPFGVLKFRTMFVDAERQLAELRGANERSGPLFKMEGDPRVTAVGRLLRYTSLDELPQLVNVLRGQMSLVGPRPALPSEVATFSADLRQREQVRPGITGLWQVEARDNPSFEAYRRLDLFYVENWSITLDLFILIATVEHLVGRLFAAVRPHKSEHDVVFRPGAIPDEVAA
jgi:exopolysaccharide biosynthesis polyprenyl glycosylphosphotransferase